MSSQKSRYTIVIDKLSRRAFWHAPCSLPVRCGRRALAHRRSDGARLPLTLARGAVPTTVNPIPLSSTPLTLTIYLSPLPLFYPMHLSSLPLPPYQPIRTSYPHFLLSPCLPACSYTRSKDIKYECERFGPVLCVERDARARCALVEFKR
jgi:hypothetical protein